jgi:hypothetical protein
VYSIRSQINLGARIHNNPWNTESTLPYNPLFGDKVARSLMASIPPQSGPSGSESRAEAILEHDSSTNHMIRRYRKLNKRMDGTAFTRWALS